MSAAEAGGLSSLGLYAGLLILPFGGWILSHRIGLELGSIACTAVATALTAFIPSGLHPVSIVIALGLAIGLGSGPMFTLATEYLKPEERALAMALLFSLLNVAQFAGPAIAGWAQDLTNWPAMPFYVAALYMALATLALVVYRLRRARGESEQEPRVAGMTERRLR
jgi:MFS family permease